MQRKAILQFHKGSITDCQIHGNTIYTASTDSTVVLTQLSPLQFIRRVVTISPLNSILVLKTDRIGLIAAGDGALSSFSTDFTPLGVVKTNFNFV